MEGIHFELFESLPRQGPGDNASTRRAFEVLAGLPKHPLILDAGCGAGAQTLVLAKVSNGSIIALDNHPTFIQILRDNVRQAGFSPRIQFVVGDMAHMALKSQSFDVIWSEGAAYNVGFENALKSWRLLIRPQGHLVVSELVWFNKGAPQEIRDYFSREYPNMMHDEDVCLVAESAGYEIVDSFRLPGESWWTDYYTPARKQLAAMRIQYQRDINAQSFFDSFEMEMDVHSTYSDYYGYRFYVMKTVTQWG